MYIALIHNNYKKISLYIYTQEPKHYDQSNNELAHLWRTAQLQPTLSWMPQVLGKWPETDCTQMFTTVTIRDIANWWCLNSEVPSNDIPMYSIGLISDELVARTLTGIQHPVLESLQTF
ncbi:hypothetical protein TNCV_4027001 [Trichonephila clavipes]|nr:hypothetical protein TNCV_4027001 [Trichonephila clavipes]